MWLHVRSMGQWTNRLYEYFRQAESQEVCPKRLATSLRKRQQQVGTSGNICSWPALQSLIGVCAAQKDQIFPCSDSEGAVPSNQDDDIKLTMFRQNGSQSGSASEEPGLAERGEGSLLREVCPSVFILISSIDLQWLGVQRERTD